MTGSADETCGKGAGEADDSLDPDLIPTIAAEGGRVSTSTASGAPVRIEHPGSVIGPYTLVERLGEGGFGTVWRADQSEPVRRQVAFKIIKAGRDTEEVIQRFEQERQALAVMDHPNIARVYDAGATPSGRPWFAMELVEGEAVTVYCDRRRLTIPERLKLFIPVCRAVQHAHAKGIVHRDLKPSNVLVAEHDGRPAPRVIDFGIAKAIEERPGEKALQTLEGVAIGTPVYMSPEQLNNSADVDTRTDVYSLGVLLYEILAGVPPIDPKELRKAGHAEMERIICEVDPPRPSLRVETATAETAAHRRSDSRAMVRKIRGDLDWIVMKALEKDRARRYDTVAGLATDIEHYLADEPVSAAAPSLGYQLSKLVRRHRGPLGAAAAMVVLIAVGAAISTWQAVRATRAEDEAVMARDEAEHNERVVAYRLAEEVAPRDNPRLGLARLEKMVRDDPSNRLIAERLMMAAQQRDFIRPATPRWGGHYVRFSGDGSVMLAANTGGFSEVYFMDTADMEPAGEVLQLATPPSWAEFSPDGRLVATASGPANGDPARVEVWDWSTGERISSPMEFGKRIHFVRFSPDGSRVAAGAAGWLVKIAATQAGNVAPDGALIDEPKLIRRYGPVIAGDWSPDGRLLAIAVSSSIRSTAEVWDTESNPPTLVAEVSHGPPVEEGDDFKAGIAIVRFSADGSRFLTAGRDGTARLWETATGRPIGEAMAHRDGVDVAEFNRDSSLIVTGSQDGTVRVWTGEAGAPVTDRLEMSGPVTSAHFDPQGLRIIAGDQKGEVAVWDAWTGEPRGARFRKEGSVYEAVFFPVSESRLVMVSSASKGQLWHLWPRQPEALVLRHEIEATNLNPIYSGFRAAMSTDGRHVVSPGFGGDFRLWDVAAGKVMDTLPGLGQRQQARFSHDGRTVLTFCEPSGISVYRFGNDGSIEGRLGVNLSPGVTTAELSPATDATVFAGGGFSLNQAYLWRIDADGEIQETELFPSDAGRDAATYIVRFDRTGKRLATASWDRRVRVWEVTSGDLLLELSVEANAEHLSFIESIDFSPDAERLLVGYSDNRAIVYDVSSKLEAIDRIVFTVHHRDEASSARYSPDGLRFVTASMDQTAQVWHAKTGEPVGLALEHGGPVSTANFSPDSRRVVTASRDGTARIWDASTGFPLSDPLGHDGIVHHAEFSADGRQVVTTSADGTIRIWDVPSAPDGEVPEWVARWIESVIGLRIEDDGQATDLGDSLESWAAMRAEVMALSDDDYYARIAKWFYRDFGTGPLTPFSRIDLDGFVAATLGMETTASLEEAARLSPHEPEVLMALARRLRQDQGDADHITALRAIALERLAAALSAGDAGSPRGKDAD